MKTLIFLMLGLSVYGNATAVTPGAAASAAVPLSYQRAQSAVMAYLSAIDTPITPSVWQALGSQAIGPLQEVIRDRSSFPTRCAKALEGLSWISGEEALPLLRAAARDSSEPAVVRFAALRGIAQVVDKAALSGELRPLLEGAADARVRAFAGAQLTSRDAWAYCGLVKAQADRETAEQRPQFERALKNCTTEPHQLDQQ